jgi:hypothetical protein
MRTTLSSHHLRLLGSLIGTLFLFSGCGGNDPAGDASEPVGQAPAPAPAPAPVPAATGSATLSWNAPAAAPAGYRVYHGTASRTYAQPLGTGAYTSSTTLTVSRLPTGLTYYFAVTAVDGAGVESGFSNEATKFIP